MFMKNKMLQQVMNLGLMLAAALLCLNAAHAAVEYKEGEHYKVCAESITAKPEIREFFSFWCGHCFAMQPTFKKIEETYQGKAQFIQNPVGLLGGMMGPESQRAFAAASLMGLQQEFTDRLFHDMHVNNKIPHSHADMAAFFARELGIPESKFERDYSAFPVAGMVAEYDRQVESHDLDAVPEILVNGKYLAVMESVDSDEALIDLIGYLLTLK